MRRTNLSTRDLAEALRQQGKPPDVSKVQFAYLERNGRISVVAARDEPRIVVVSVAEGVQTVRIELK
jgi:uncharacterized membrane protein YcaP (DUF421 family)